MKILVTGANGFLGSHIVEMALLKGHETFAAARPKADTTHLRDFSGFKLVEVDYNNFEKCLDECHGKLDLIVHNAGLTKSFSPERYLQVNEGLTRKVIEAVKGTNALADGGKFVYISSMAAKGPMDCNGPVSNYGRSKLKAEETVKNSGLDFIIFRPTGIYGARDIQFLPLIKTIRMGLYPLMTSRQHKMTLINARDAAENILTIGSSGHKNKIVHLDDGNVYQHQDLKSTLETILGKKSRSLILPESIILPFLHLADLTARLLGKSPGISVEQYREISKDWNYDFNEERKSVPLTIKYTLADGFKDALTYYRDKNLI